VNCSWCARPINRFVALHMLTTPSVFRLLSSLIFLSMFDHLSYTKIENYYIFYYVCFITIKLET
jgi:hypothetical protein